MKPEKKSRKSKKGGTVELAPIVATGALYVAAAYNKKARKMRGGADAVVSTPGGAVPVITVMKPEMPTKVEPAIAGKAVPAIEMVPVDVRRESPAAAAVTGSAAQSPLVAGMLDLSKNAYIGAVSASRPASVSAPGGLLEGGGKKKKSRKYKGGDCHPMDGPIPTNAGAGGDIRAVPVVVGAVGGVAGQEEPELIGGAKKRKSSKSKKRGGEGCGAPIEETMPMAGGAKKRKSKKRGGADGEEEPEMPEMPMEGGAKKRKSKSKKRGGAHGEEEPEMPEMPMEGGAKKSKSKSKKRGGAHGEEEPEMPEMPEDEGGSAEDDIAAMKGGAKKRKSKKRGGAEPEPFDAGADKSASATGDFDKLLADVKAQVGGKYKKKGGAFKLYAKELESLSKKLKKLM